MLTKLIVHSSGNHFDSTSVKLGSQTLKPTTASKCLGTWWTHNLTSTKFIAENVCKARKAFFSFGSIGIFHGNLNPLSSNSVIKTCVMPVLLFGCERFQCNIGRRILQLSRFHSNISIRIGLDWPSVRARVFIQKLNYLRRLVNKGDDKLNSQIFHLFASKDISQLTIVEQCRYLEAVYDTDFTS